GLIGPYPEASETYRERAPIRHVDRLSVPLLLLQGAEDVVVPPNQAETMATAVRTKGLPVAMIIFEGEGHGFRRAESIKAALEAQLYFLGRVFDFKPADELPVIEIDNL
ncbi:MAG: prolyl oligopeptidase family serine peptidase, partial [Microlunatus sp.]|nr:prolyl oligopeptidase family serine peptidase [Microlunatus sp.]